MIKISLLNKRLRILFYFMLFAFFILVGMLFYTQVWNTEGYTRLSLHNRIRRVLIEAPRGKIYDREGVLLADNRPRFDLALIREELPRDRKEYVQFLSRFLKIPQKRIWDTLQKTATVPYLPAILFHDIDMERVTQIEESQERLPALHLQIQPTRNYLMGPECAHLIGTIGKIPQNEVEDWKDKGVHVNEIVGRSGVEKKFDALLRGTVGGMQVQVNNRGYLDQVLGKQDPVPGQDLVLTIDSRLQKKVNEVLQDKKGVGIVLDVASGEILALVSQPAFDPNLFVTSSKREPIRNLLHDKSKPLFSRANLGVYSPGSLFKLIVALAYMSEHPEDWQDRTIFCDGHFNLGQSEFLCWKKRGHGSLELLDALKHSCNIYFYTIGLEFGPEKIAETASQFGFGENTRFLLGEQNGLVPTPAWKKARYNQNWYGGDTANFSIGQGPILCTPLQMAAFFRSIAADAEWQTPKIIKDQEIKAYSLSQFKEWIPFLKEGMRRVVQDVDGTGRQAWLPEFPAAGKTGTVEVAKEAGLKHTWFAGFAPFEKPEIVVVILVEEGESGGRTAAPLAREIFKEYMAIQQQGKGK